ncbi:CCA tRNA nucleotidyltransferase, partial [Myxococcota bacterium]|nr:CCA tRNA nucleotidyltransferase [Myxococcota bacterium]
MAPVDPSALRAGAREVAQKLRAAGYEAYFAGGCVRDVLRGETPKDWDVVTNARPPEVTKLFRRTVQVGAAFGVVRVLIGGDREYEVATYREDGGYTDGRHPDEVRYSTSKEEDVERRDFTINALLMDPETGEILDFVGGRRDLDARLIRAVGAPDARFGEDRLRMLRAIRFAARFGYAIEAETLAAIHRHASAIDAVSIERIVTELEGIFDARDPAHGFDLLVSTGLFQAVLPKIDVADAAVRATLRERLARLPDELGPGERAEVAWAALWDLAKTDDLEADLRALKLSKRALRDIQRLLEKKGILVAPERARTYERMRLLVDDTAP